MAGGKGGLMPHIEQRDFIAQQQRAADLWGRDGWWGHGAVGLDESCGYTCTVALIDSTQSERRPRERAGVSRENFPES
jgi:hypothetical protein